MPNILMNLPAGFYKTPSLKPLLRRIAALGPVRHRSHNTPAEIARDLPWAEAILMWSWPSIDEELVKLAPKLRFLGQIDVSRATAEMALARKLPFSTSRRCWSPAVAEMALTLMLTALRKVSDYHLQMRAGKEAWIADFPVQVDLQERELTGATVGIVGLGAVGRRLAQLLAPFKVRLLVHDPFLGAEAIAAAGGEPADMDQLVAACDVISLCAASNQGTTKILDAKRIRALRKHAVLVNVARSALVDQDALGKRLAKRDLIACIDVFDHEPLARNAPMRKWPNTYLTPHRAGGIMASVHRAIGMLVDDLEAHLADRPLQYPFVPAMLPGLDG